MYRHALQPNHKLPRLESPEDYSREVPITTDVDYGRWAWTSFPADIQLRTARMDLQAEPDQWHTFSKDVGL